jgi:Putative phage tail protein
MGLFGGGAVNTAAPPAAASGIQLQTSQFGSVIPIGWGSFRVAPNILWYGDFQAVEHHESQGGGKGGPDLSQTSFTYKVSFVLGLCEGPIAGTGTVWRDKDVTDAATLGFAVFTGADGQAPWGYLTTNHPGEDLGYSGTAYAAAAGLELDSANMPQFALEVTVGTAADWEPSDIATAYLTDPRYGAGFPAARLGDWSQWATYCTALDLLMAPCLIGQEAASDFVQRLADLTNTAAVWSADRLNMIPYGDTLVSANGVTFTPNVTPVVDLSEDHFLDQNEPVRITMKDSADAENSVTLEFEDRANQYIATPTEAKDQASIEAYGLRRASAITAHEYKTLDRAALAAQMILQRKVSIRAVYEFKLPWNFFGLEPMDLVTLTSPTQSLDHYVVRLTRVQEDDNGDIVCEAEDFPQGVAHASRYGRQQGAGYLANFNAAPGSANLPVLFEPTDAYAGDLEVIVGVSGSALWGGADLWASQDGEAYSRVGTIRRGIRTGTLTTALPAVARAATGRTIDAANTVTVDLTECGGTLTSVSQVDAVAANTLCWIDGEMIAYQTATLVAPNVYRLSWLARGLYGTPITAHGAGARFLRMAASNPPLAIPFTADRIGQALYLKLVSFNLYGGGLQALGNVAALRYTLQGAALASPLPDVTSLVSSFVAGITQLSWLPVDDFRAVDYEVRKGATPTGAQVLGRTSQTRFPSFGDGTYWVAAHANPRPGLHVYSLHWTEIQIACATLVKNVIATWDEAASGWGGTVDGSAGVAGGQVSLTGAGNVLTATDFLGIADLLSYGGIGAAGTYAIPTGHRIDVGRVAPCSVLMSWSSIGQVVGSDVLGVGDFLGLADVLGDAASANTSVYPEIRVAQADGVYGAWQKFIPGTYSGRFFDARVQILSADPQTAAILQGFSFAVDVPDRVEDHTIATNAGAATIVTYPGGAFNGASGGGNGSVPNPQVTVLNGAAGDVVAITSIALSGFTISVTNGGAIVSRNLNFRAQGW